MIRRNDVDTTEDDRHPELLPSSPHLTEHPDGLSVWNKAVGSAVVSLHAWEQFAVRFAETRKLKSIKRPQHYFIGMLTASFARAIHEEIDRGHKVRRIINNDFKGAIYIRDAAVNLRYVVSEDRPHVLITVEIPY